MSEASPSSNPHLTISADQMAALAEYLEQLPHPVRLHVWGLADASQEEGEAMRLCQALADSYDGIRWRRFSRRAGYAYYPVIGVMGEEDDRAVDYGLRLIGLPAGFQLTSLIAAIQAASFQGVTLEPKTRIRLQKLETDMTLQLITRADDELGPVMARIAFGLAVSSARVKAYLIMSDMFPEAAVRHSVYMLPHLVFNDRVHLSGRADEETVLRHMAMAAARAS